MEVIAHFQPPAEIAAFYRSMIDSLRATPGVQAAAHTWLTQLSEYVPKAAMHSADHAQEEHSLVYNIVGDEYFSTLGTHPSNFAHKWSNTSLDIVAAVGNEKWEGDGCSHFQAIFTSSSEAPSKELGGRL